MNKVTQLLLLLSYGVFGFGALVLLPLVGVSPATAQIAAILVFFGAWQVQMSFFSNSKNDIDPIDMHRVEEIEKLALKLRKDVAELQEAVAEQSEKGDAKDKKLVSELKTLQEFLLQVMQKETKGKKPRANAAKPAPPPAEEVDLDDEQMTAEEIEELGLAPEEAAMVVIDDDRHDEAAAIAPATDNEPDADNRDMGNSDMDNDNSTIEGDLAASAPVDDEGSSPSGAASDPTRERPAAKDKVRAIGVPAKSADPSARVQTHAQRRAAAAKKRAPIRLIKREDQLLSVIKNSLSENRVDLYLQPIVSLPARKTAHFECFSRVRDEEGRIVLPRQYMKVAETRGLIGTIDNLLLFRLIQLVRKLGRRRPDVRFFLNMSRYSIADKEFLPQFIDFMASNTEFADRMVFEISQEDYLTLEEEAVDRLGTLGRKGFAFSMDLVTDFNQDFAELEKRNFKYIKADLTDIVELHPDMGEIEEQRDYLRRRSMQLIASKIENEDMVIEALDNQLELAQGYLFGEPLSAEDIDMDL